MLSRNVRSVVRRGGIVFALSSLFGVLSLGTAKSEWMQAGAAVSSKMAAAPAITLICSPCTIPSQQKAQVKFAVQVPARVAEAGNVLSLQLGRTVPGKAPAMLGVMTRESASGSTVTYSLSVPFSEQPGSFSVAVYVQQPATRAAMLAENQRSVAGPVQITVQNSSQGNASSGSGLGGLLTTLLDSLRTGPGKNQSTSDGKTNQPEIVRGPGVSFNLPAGFRFHREIADAGGPVSLRNFDQYNQGGVVPQGGAEIEVTSVPAGGTSLQALLREETSADVSQGVSVDTLPAQIASYTDLFAPGWSYDSQAAYVVQDGRIYKFFLTYRSGDAASAGYRQAFSTVLNTTHFSAR